MGGGGEIKKSMKSTTYAHTGDANRRFLRVVEKNPKCLWVVQGSTNGGWTRQLGLDPKTQVAGYLSFVLTRRRARCGRGLLPLFRK